MLHRLLPLRRDARGSAIAEFAVLAPVMILLITATVEAAHLFMVKITLDGAVTTAARKAVADLTLTDDARDAQMRAGIGSVMSAYRVAPGQSLSIQTKVYRTIGSAYPEAYQDMNGNGIYDGPTESFAGEPFDDRNRNGIRDLAAPVTGKMGGEGDVVAYTVVFPTELYFGFLSPIFGNRTVITSSTIARNEPESGMTP